MRYWGDIPNKRLIKMVCDFTQKSRNYVAKLMLLMKKEVKNILS